MNSSILVIEDDRFLQQNLIKLLSSDGHQVEGVASGEEGLQRLSGRRYDMVVLDLGLPGMDGFATCRKIRAAFHMPILMLTARTDAMDKVLGLETGADDYLTKPFDAKEFMARVRAQLRRATDYQSAEAPKTEGSYSIGDLVVDFERREISVGGRKIDLTSREYDIVAYLAKNPDRAISREQLFETVWGYELELSTNSLDVYIYRIRKKIEENPNEPTYLHTLRGFGYKLSLA